MLNLHLNHNTSWLNNLCRWCQQHTSRPCKLHLKLQWSQINKSWSSSKMHLLRSNSFLKKYSRSSKKLALLKRRLIPLRSKRKSLILHLWRPINLKFSLSLKRILSRTSVPTWPCFSWMKTLSLKRMLILRRVNIIRRKRRVKKRNIIKRKSIIKRSRRKNRLRQLLLKLAQQWMKHIIRSMDHKAVISWSHLIQARAMKVVKLQFKLKRNLNTIKLKRHRNRRVRRLMHQRIKIKMRISWKNKWLKNPQKKV